MWQLEAEIICAEIHAAPPTLPASTASVSSSLARNLGHGDARELLVDRVALLRGLVRLLEKTLEARGIGALDHAEARLVAHVVGDPRFRRTIVEMERRFALGQAARIETVERPYAGIHRQLLLRHAVSHVVAVGDAMAVGDDERRPGIGLGLEKCLHGLRHLGPHGDAGDVDVTVLLASRPRSFLPCAFPAEANFATAPSGVALDCWPPVLE